ncbi:hypothetical protein [Kosakonia oryzendophytica]|uniref:hypothetical protein n=1 Tax=Kosakonia oryzendophytica TaxID=1005665 RepID=UPI000A73E8BB|nr:hypothetical protein [Kosakonia oryzendophytica]WBT56617.1 hypothetical protein O9K67_15720 [Kosakonia oryzendophytica]
MSPSEFQLYSAMAGLLGSLLSAFSTFGYEPSPLAECCDVAQMETVNKKNRIRKYGQVVGLFLIALSFLLQVISLC